MTEEARKFLELLRYIGGKNVGKRDKPPHIDTFGDLYLEDMFAKSADLIESLYAQLEQVTKERDAAVEDLKLIISGDLSCVICGHYAYDEDDESRICADCDVDTYSNWQWRGMEVEG